MTAASIISPRMWRAAEATAAREGMTARAVIRRWLNVAAEMAALRVSPRLTGKPALAKAA